MMLMLLEWIFQLLLGTGWRSEYAAFPRRPPLDVLLIFPLSHVCFSTPIRRLQNVLYVRVIYELQKYVSFYPISLYYS